MMHAPEPWMRSLPPDLAGPPRPGFALPCLLVLTAILFNAFLCFMNTRGVHVSESTIVLAEALILSATFLTVVRVMNAAALIFIIACLLYLMTIVSIRSLVQGDSFDIKVGRDLMVPAAFFLLGTRTADPRHADRIVTCSAVLIGIGAVLEFVSLDTFLHWFDIINFYVAKGSVESARLKILSTKLFVSGMRPEGRSLFPGLGNHRISSFFLEPVSAGNYGVILFYWALIRFRSVSTWICLAWIVIALLLIIGADSRLGIWLCGAGLIIAMLPRRAVSIALVLAPAVAVLTLLYLAAAMPNTAGDDSFLGRLLSSGRLLTTFDGANWLGLGTIAWQGFDSGYSYVIGRIGVPGFAALWCVLLLIPCEDTKALLSRQLTALYLIVVLTISYSPLTIKTASLLWFLFGVMVAHAMQRRYAASGLQQLPGNMMISAAA